MMSVLPVSVLLCSSTYQTYFGGGTRLTVLESNRTISLPTVTVIQPSQNECQNKKDKKTKRTLVCVASGFYPDHVSMSWEINGEKITYGVATDNTAQRHGDYYRITSRLRVLLRPWLITSNNFTCIVSFFDGKKTVYRSNTFESVEGPGAEFVKGDYLRSRTLPNCPTFVSSSRAPSMGFLWRFWCGGFRAHLEKATTKS